jgi:hypothetical protein
MKWGLSSNGWDRVQMRPQGTHRFSRIEIPHRKSRKNAPQIGFYERKNDGWRSRCV